MKAVLWQQHNFIASDAARTCDVFPWSPVIYSEGIVVSFYERVTLQKYSYIYGYFVVSFPYFNGTVQCGSGFIIPSIYGYKRMRNRFRKNMENPPQNIRGYTDIFYSVYYTHVILFLYDTIQYDT